MKNLENLSVRTEHHAEAWFSWPQSITVPKGWLFRTYNHSDFRRAGCDTEFDLFCSGDWLEMVNEEDGTLIRHVID